MGTFLERMNNDLTKGFKTLLILFALAAIFSVLVVFASLRPFEPYDPISYDLVPSEVCAGEPVQVFTTRNIHDGLYSVDTYDVDSTWQYVDGRTLPAGNVERIPIQSANTGKVASEVVRTAPTIGGEVNLHSTVIVHGKMFWFVPTTQTVELTTEDTVTVNSLYSAECLER